MIVRIENQNVHSSIPIKISIDFHHAIPTLVKNPIMYKIYLILP